MAKKNLRTSRGASNHANSGSSQEVGSPSSTTSTVSGDQPERLVSLDVLCRRADRLIETVRMMSEQMEQMLTEPNRAVEKAERTTRSLNALSQQLERKMAEAQTKMAEVQAAERASLDRLQELQSATPTIHQAAQALIERVQRARQLTEAFGKMMDGSADRVTELQSAGDRLRTLTEASEKVGETVRQEVVTLRELLRESRQERLAWEQFLSRLPSVPAASAAPAPLVPSAASKSKIAENLKPTRTVRIQAADPIEMLIGNQA